MPRRPKPRHLAEDFDFDFDYVASPARKSARPRRPTSVAEDAEAAATMPEQVAFEVCTITAMPGFSMSVSIPAQIATHHLQGFRQ